jgi:transcriptional regulator with XRE-family HTH domain
VSVAVDFARAGGGWAGPLVFNVWLRRQLRERRISQRQLGVMSGVDHSAISRLVNGHASPTLETAAKLVHALRLDWSEQQVATYFELLPEHTLLPTQRVESALRGDGSLSDDDVLAVMHQYLMLRKRGKLSTAGSSPQAEAGELRETGGP